MNLTILYLQNKDPIILQQITRQINTGNTSNVNTTNSSGCQTTNNSQSTTSNTVSSPLSTFSPYQLTYKGDQIAAQLSTNQPLISAINAVTNSSQWNHTLTMITESASIPSIIEFTVYG
jgi:hypothetical protein